MEQVDVPRATPSMKSSEESRSKGSQPHPALRHRQLNAFSESAVGCGCGRHFWYLSGSFSALFKFSASTTSCSDEFCSLIKHCEKKYFLLSGLNFLPCQSQRGKRDSLRIPILLPFEGNVLKLWGMLLGETQDPVAGALKALADDLFQLARSSPGFSAFKVDASKPDGGKRLLTLGWYLRSSAILAWLEQLC